MPRLRSLPGLLSGVAFLLVAFVLPLLMVAANRSSIAVFVSAAAWALLASLLGNQGRAALARLGGLLATPEALAVMLFVAWSLVSIAWSPDIAGSLFAVGEALLPVGALLVLLVTLADRPPRWLPVVALAGIGLTLVGLPFELRDGLRLRHILSDRVFSYSLNRAMVVALLLALPCIGLLLRWKRPLVALAALLALAVVTLISDSGSSVLGLIAALAAYAFARLAPRLAVGFGLACALFALFGAPLMGDVASHLIPERAVMAIEDSHAVERIGIWQSFGEVARLRPWHGVGFDASAKLADSAVADEIPPQYRASLSWGHPHNAFLQIWVELGIPGVVLAAICLFFLFRALVQQPDEEIAIRLAAIAAVLAIAIESHGAWQGWWFAGIGAQIFLFVCFSRREATAPP